MKICIKNATLISMSEKMDTIEENMDVLIEDSKVVKIQRNIYPDNNTKIIDAAGKVVMPGLINTHAHVPMSIFRETLDGYSLQEWLNDKIWPMEDKLTNEDIYYASYLSFLEMIKTGTTTINDMYFMTEDIIRAMQDTKIRLQTTRTLMDMSEGEKNERLNELGQVIQKYKNKDEKLTFNVGIHGLYTSNERYVQKCIEFAKENNLIVNMHFCENLKEVEDIRNIYNKEPIEVLEDNFKNVKVILAHAVKLSKEDILKLKDMNVSISHCPVSNLKLGCGIANVNEMVENNINVSLGTDGQGSGSNLDLFETMKYTALLQKGLTQDPKSMPAYEVLKMATINGAKALGLDRQIGSIEEGKKADIIILDLNDIVIQPINNLISEIVYNVKGSNVETTIINGEILMENKTLININQKDILKRAKQIIDRIKE